MLYLGLIRTCLQGMDANFQFLTWCPFGVYSSQSPYVVKLLYPRPDFTTRWNKTKGRFRMITSSFRRLPVARLSPTDTGHVFSFRTLQFLNPSFDAYFFFLTGLLQFTQNHQESLDDQHRRTVGSFTYYLFRISTQPLPFLSTSTS